MATKIPKGLINRVAKGKENRQLARRDQLRHVMNSLVNNGGYNGAAGDLSANSMLMRAELLKNMFDDRRDIDTECGYPKSISTAQYRYMFDREGIARRVVSIFPEECWAQDPAITETEDAEKTAFELLLGELNDEHNLIHYLQRIDVLSGIGSFGVLLLGIGDGKEMHEPVDGIILEGRDAGRKVGFKEKALDKPDPADPEADPPDPEKDDGDNEGDKPDIEDLPPNTDADAFEPDNELMFIRVFDESLVSVHEYESDTTNRRYGQPTFYNMQFNDPSAFGTGDAALPDATTHKVHWTRVIHIADNRTSSEVFGTPRMQETFNRLYDLRKLLGGSAEMFWKGAFPGYAFEVNPDLGDVTLDSAAMRTEFEAYANGLQRYLALTGVTAKSLAVQVASPEDHVMIQIKAIAITVKAPMRIFMGSEAAHLASTQDAQTWNNRLAYRQTKYLTPLLIRPVINHLIAAGILPEPVAYTVEWPDLNSPTDENRATVAELFIKAIANYITSGADALIPPLEFLTIFLGMDTEQAEAILEAALEHVEEKEDLEVDETARRADKGLVDPDAEFIDDDDPDSGGNVQSGTEPGAPKKKKAVKKKGPGVPKKKVPRKATE